MMNKANNLLKCLTAICEQSKTTRGFKHNQVNLRQYFSHNGVPCYGKMGSFLKNKNFITVERLGLNGSKTTWIFPSSPTLKLAQMILDGIRAYNFPKDKDALVACLKCIKRANDEGRYFQYPGGLNSFFEDAGVLRYKGIKEALLVEQLLSVSTGDGGVEFEWIGKNSPNEAMSKFIREKAASYRTKPIKEIIKQEFEEIKPKAIVEDDFRQNLHNNDTLQALDNVYDDPIKASIVKTIGLIENRITLDTQRIKDLQKLL